MPRVAAGPDSAAGEMLLLCNGSKCSAYKMIARKLNRDSVVYRPFGTPMRGRNVCSFSGLVSGRSPDLEVSGDPCPIGHFVQGNEMRRLALLTALAATALAGPAFARDNSWYVGVEGGLMQPQDTKFNVGPSPLSPGGRTTIDNKLGYDVDAILGYDFGMFRLEEEDQKTARFERRRAIQF